MSNRLSKGKITAGKMQQDVPGDVKSGFVFTSASTSVQTSSFQFPIGALISDVIVKITSVAATSGTLNVGLATNSASSGVSTALISGLAIGTTGTFLACPSTSHPTLSFSVGSYLISSTSESVTILKKHVVASTDTYQYLNYTVSTTAAVAGSFYPIFSELA